MSKVDCSVMSHPACYEPEPSESPVEAAKTPSPDEDPAAFGSYDCVNDCVSSLA